MQPPFAPTHLSHLGTRGALFRPRCFWPTQSDPAHRPRQACASHAPPPTSASLARAARSAASAASICSPRLPACARAAAAACAFSSSTCGQGIGVDAAAWGDGGWGNGGPWGVGEGEEGAGQGRAWQGGGKSGRTMPPAPSNTLCAACMHST